MSKRIVVPVVFAVLGVAAFLVLRGGSVEVSVAEAGRDTLSVTIPAEGMTRARERFTVTAPVTGRSTRIGVEEGDVVTEGQRLLRLYPTPQDPRTAATARAELDAAQARYRQAEAALREAELQARQAVREVERRRPLAEMGAISRERMEQAELAATVAQERREAAESDVASARAAVEGARARLLGVESTGDEGDPVEVRAPVSGRVLRVPDASARIVSAGEPLVVLADIDRLEVVLDILSEDAVRVEPGNRIVLTGWGGETPLLGKVRSVTRVGYTEVSALGVEEQRVDIVADLQNRPPSLGSGYRVSGEIVVWRGDDVLVAPTSALFRDGGSWRLFVVDDGRARLREVVVGHRNEEAVEILEGVEEGEQVILFPTESVEDGTTVEVTSR
ncbi:MAG: efflux RND transporter periplasmic adaptor subunit [Longimicrobiales bacterium]|nr:efflux RND transporter periplasmic adaptor subunit [Longimicrobiales bacterium]